MDTMTPEQIWANINETASKMTVEEASSFISALINKLEDKLAELESEDEDEGEDEDGDN